MSGKKLGRSLFLLAAGGLLIVSAGTCGRMRNPEQGSVLEAAGAGDICGPLSGNAVEPGAGNGCGAGAGNAMEPGAGNGCGPREAAEVDIELLKQYQELCPAVTCILRIPGTVLCHPVVQTPEEEEYYLYRDLTGKYNSHGVPFLSAGSDLERRGGNAVIYGHNIYKKTRDVFCDLAGYEDVEYYKEHPIIETISESGLLRWLIFAYYLVDNGDEDPFRYSDVTTFAGPEELESYLEEIRIRNWLLVDANVEYGDSLLTLSSCSVELAGSGTNRMVVVGKLLEDGEDPAEIIEKASQAEHPLLPARLR